MGLLDDLSKQVGGLGGSALTNPQVIAAVVSLLSTHDSPVGGSGGLGALVQAFQGKGMGDLVSSWIATGPNPPATADQISSVLGAGTLEQFAARAGVSHGEAGGLLAALLPTVIDRLTPQGKVPDASALEPALGGLLSGFGR
jgi:uncharacterized protein YidB (DUF937 family)